MIIDYYGHLHLYNMMVYASVVQIYESPRVFVLLNVKPARTPSLEAPLQLMRKLDMHA